MGWFKSNECPGKAGEFMFLSYYGMMSGIRHGVEYASQRMSSGIVRHGVQRNYHRCVSSLLENIRVSRDIVRVVVVSSECCNCRHVTAANAISLRSSAIGKAKLSIL